MKKITKQQVADVLYRSASNYKQSFTFLIPMGLKIEVGDDVPVREFGITENEWFEDILPTRGFVYDETEDHYFVEIEEIRDRADDDILTNVDEKGELA